jgi:hypothetical protein
MQQNLHSLRLPGFSYIAVIALLALAVRLAPLAQPDGAWMYEADSESYTRLTKGLLNGCGFARWEHGACGAPELFRTPGYPLFLAAVPSPRPALVAQAALEAGTVLVIGAAAAAVAGGMAGMVAASIFAFDVSSISNCVRILSDPLFTALVAIALGLQIVAIFRFPGSTKRLAVSFVSAGLIGVAILVRPVGVVLVVMAPLLLSPLERWTSRNVVMAIVLSAIAAGPALAWSVRNFERRGVFSLSVTPQYNLYFYRAAGLLARAKGISLGREQAILIREQPKSCKIDFSDSSPECFKVLNRHAFEVFLQYPAWLAQDVARGTATALLGPGVQAIKKMVGIEPQTDVRTAGMAGAVALGLIAFEVVLLAVTWIGVLFAAFKLGLPWRWSYYPLLLPLASAALMVLASAGPEGYSRYRTPIMPMIAIISGIGWTLMLRPQLLASETENGLRRWHPPANRTSPERLAGDKWPSPDTHLVSICTRKPSGSSRVPAMKSPLMSVTHRWCPTKWTPEGLTKPDATNFNSPALVTR